MAYLTPALTSIPRASKTLLNNSRLFSSLDHLSALGIGGSLGVLVAIFLLFLSMGSEVLGANDHICSQLRAGAEPLLVKQVTGLQGTDYTEVGMWEREGVYLKGRPWIGRSVGVTVGSGYNASPIFPSSRHSSRHEGSPAPVSRQ